MDPNEARQLNTEQPPARGDVAIVGMACLLPGAPDLDAYWHNIVSKVDAITDPPAESWDPNVFYDPASSANNRVYCKRGGFIGPLAYFDPLAHGIMPNAIEGTEPDQWLALQVARAAFTDAGYGEQIPEHERTAVIFGKGTYLNRGNLTAAQHGQVIDQTLDILKSLHPEYTVADLQSIQEELKKRLPPFNADTAPGLIPNVIAGRIANRLNLMGPSYTIDAACASSLVATEIAMRNLLTKQCDLALVGGIHVVTPVPVLMLFCQLNALSRNEQIRPFDKNADGTILSEGVGMIVLRRVEDALRDGQRIYAVIKGVGIASDGRGLSVMAPRVEGEILAMQRAYELAGIAPGTIGLIEAHGTGTPVGDVTEVKALNHVFGSRTSTLPSCALGSVKSMIGHVMPAAGMAGLIRAALSIYHKTLPPTLHVEEPNPELELDKTIFYLNTETRPWIHGTPDTPRRAGVNAFGFGGINAHVILEEPPAETATAFQSREVQWNSEVFVLSAASRSALIERMQHVQQALSTNSAVHLKDLAYTLNTTPAETGSRIAIVAASLDDLRQKLDRTVKQLADPDCRQIKDVQGIYFFEQPLAGQLAFLFPGEGSQYVNMLADLCRYFPEIRAHFDTIDRVFYRHTRNYVPSDSIFPRPGFSTSDRKNAEASIHQMEGAVEAVLTANRALFTLLDRLEVRPDCIVGHSTGEYSAMLAAGMIDLDEEALIAQFSLELNQIYRQALDANTITHATLLAVAASADQVQSIIAEMNGVHVAMDNCPHQTVLAVPDQLIEQVMAQLQRRGLIYERLPFDRPYHTALFKAYTERLQPFLAKWITASPRLKTYSCTTLSPFPDETTQVQQVALEHWLRPVEFRKTIETMYADGVRLFVEVGTSGNLTAFVDDILRGKPHLAAPANLRSRSGTTQLNHLVGMLAAQAVPLNLGYLYQYRSPQRLDPDHLDEADGSRKARSRIKLATGWPPTGISDDLAARLRAKSQPAAPLETATPAVKHEAPPAAATTITTSAAPASKNGKVPAPQSPAQTPATAGGQVMSAHLRLMNQFLSTQQDVMQAYLTGRSTAPAASGSIIQEHPTSNGNGVSAEPVPISTTQPQQELAVPEAPPATEKQQGLGIDDIRNLLLELVSERTGYPIEMLDLNLDLEAQLGIDSIKRVEILGSFQQQTGLLRSEDMESLAGRKTLQSVIDVLKMRLNGSSELESASTSNVSALAAPTVIAAPAPLPLISRVMSLTPGEEAVAAIELSVEQLPLLRDHTLGRDISTIDPELRGLPIVPFTLSMEMMAEGAALLMPGQYLIGMREVRAYRWMLLEQGTLELEVTAQRKPASNEIQVRIREADHSANGSTSKTMPIIEGIMIFAESFPEPPSAGEFALSAERSSKWMPEHLYREGMFHGPAFRGVLSLDKVGDDGAEATLAANLHRENIRSDRGTFLTDPILLDQPGQVVGFWTAECLPRDYVIFPFYLEALQLYAAPFTDDARAQCRARIQLIGDQRVRSDLDIVGSDGRVWAHFVGWEDRRFDLPDVFHRFLLSPQETALGEAWPLAVTASADQPRLQAVWLGVDHFPKDFFTAHGGIWQRVLASLILSRSERERWSSLTQPEPRRIEWLLGRAAAKEAVRQHLKQQHDLKLCLADIEIVPDDKGRPSIQGAWLDRIPQVPTVSISHSGGMAVAIAGSGVGLGVDIEHMGRMKSETEKVAFTPQERELLAALHEAENEEWPLRLWCAKESAAKAWGQGLYGGPLRFVVRAIDQATGIVQINVIDEGGQDIDGATLATITVRQNDLIAAICCYRLESIEAGA